jgi:poly(A) polymerase
MAGELLSAARDVLMRASLAEKEVERLLKRLLPSSPFRGKAFAVGGYVRDEVMGIESDDLDVVVGFAGGAERMAEWIHRQFPTSTSRPVETGKGYPIWTVFFKADIEYEGEAYRTKGADIDLADSQKESFPDPESRQRITEPGTIEEDVARRDFTVNMLLKDLETGELKDLTGTSVNDIRNGILRGIPGLDFNKVLRDDPLRMLRLVRFQAKYGWNVPMDVLRIVAANAARIQIVSGDRIRKELVKLMEIGKLHQGIRMMKAVGLLKYVLPEVEALRGVKHDTTRGHHQEGDVYRHTLLVLKGAKPGVESQLAALLHDIGKPQTQEDLGDKIQFLGHEKVGGEIAEAIMRRMQFELPAIRKVRMMVENHMMPYAYGDASASGLRRFVRKVGEEMVDSILDLAEADQLGNLPPETMIPDLRRRIDEAMAIPMRKAPIIDGREIMTLLGMGPGPDVGRAVEFLKQKEDEYAGQGVELTKEEAKRLLLEEFPR